jgi:hypothetical protein
MLKENNSIVLKFVNNIKEQTDGVKKLEKL